MGLKPKKTKSNTLPPVVFEYDPDASPSQDRTSRFAVDRLIRSYGYRIYSRRGAVPLWAKGGVVVAQDDLLDSLDRNEVSDAEYEEMLACCAEFLYGG